MTFIFKSLQVAILIVIVVILCEASEVKDPASGVEKINENPDADPRIFHLFKRIPNFYPFKRPSFKNFKLPRPFRKLRQKNPYGPPRRPAKKPSNSYGPPKKPSGGYGAPKPPMNNYGPPKRPNTGYGPPKKPSSGYGPPKKPSSGYGPPEKPSSGYGPPQKPSSGYGPPQKPSSGYGPPKIPTSGYGPPKKPESEYASPEQPDNNYEAPPQQTYGPNENFGPPKGDDEIKSGRPQTTYEEPPKAHEISYSQPPQNQPSYNVPQQNYHSPPPSPSYHSPTDNGQKVQEPSYGVQSGEALGSVEPSYGARPAGQFGPPKPSDVSQYSPESQEQSFSLPPPTYPENDQSSFSSSSNQYQGNNNPQITNSVEENNNNQRQPQYFDSLDFHTLKPESVDYSDNKDKAVTSSAQNNQDLQFDNNYFSSSGQTEDSSSNYQQNTVQTSFQQTNTNQEQNIYNQDSQSVNNIDYQQPSSNFDNNIYQPSSNENFQQSQSNNGNYQPSQNDLNNQFQQQTFDSNYQSPMSDNDGGFLPVQPSSENNYQPSSNTGYQPPNISADNIYTSDSSTSNVDSGSSTESYNSQFNQFSSSVPVANEYQNSFGTTASNDNNFPPVYRPKTSVTKATLINTGPSSSSTPLPLEPILELYDYNPSSGNGLTDFNQFVSTSQENNNQQFPNYGPTVSSSSEFPEHLNGFSDYDIASELFSGQDDQQIDNFKPNPTYDPNSNQNPSQTPIQLNLSINYQAQTQSEPSIEVETNSPLNLNENVNQVSEEGFQTIYRDDFPSSNQQRNRQRKRGTNQKSTSSLQNFESQKVEKPNQGFGYKYSDFMTEDGWGRQV